MLFALALFFVTFLFLALFGVFAAAALQAGAVFIAVASGALALMLAVSILWCAVTAARA